MPNEAEPPPKLPPKDEGGRTAKSPYASIGTGVELAFIVMVLTAGGWWLDERFASSPWFLLLGLALGFFGGFYRFWHQAMGKDK